jgi:hypothetical protein
MYLGKVNMKYESLVDFIRHDFPEVWGFRYGLTLGISTQKIMASTGVFVRVICDLIRSISIDARTSSIIWPTYSTNKVASTWNDLSKYFPKGGKAQNKQNANRE